MKALVERIGANRLRQWLPLATLIILVILVGTLQPVFLQPATLLQLASDTPVLFILATGVTYNTLAAPGLEELTGRGVFYGSAMTEAPATAGQEVYVVGGANSAGQAAMFLSGHARRVTLLVRADGLEHSMSHYLIRQICDTANIEVRPSTTVAAAEGREHLERLRLCDSATGAVEEVPASFLFVFIGAAPCTDWLGGVAEFVTGIDLIRQQVLIAAGNPLSLAQEDVRFAGHAIECRINAEDPYRFTPSPGRITAWHAPGGPGVRVDSHAYAGYFVPPNYDSMIGKLICYGDTRAQAIARMSIALSEMVVEGILTNIPLHRELMLDEKFVQGGTSIHYLEKRLAAKQVNKS